MRIILETLFWMLVAVVLLAGVAIVVGFVTVPAFGGTAAVAMLVMLPLLLRIARSIRRRRAAVILAYLEQATRLNLPLPRMLAAAERGERGIIQHRLLHLHSYLDGGYSVGVSMQATVPELDAAAAALLTSGERLGQLPRALHQLLRERRQAARHDAANAAFFRAYPFMMIVLMTLVLGTVGSFVLPKYEAIFKDFGIQLPWITRHVFFVTGTIGPVAAVIVSVFTIWWAGRTLWNTFHPSQDLGPSVSKRLWDHLLWMLPLAGGMQRDRGLSQAFEVMTRALEGAVPAERAMREAASLGINAVLRGRLSACAQRLADGAPMHEAARDARLPGLVVEMLAPVRDIDGAADVFGFLSRYYGSRFSRSAILRENAMVPLTVLFFGFIVAAIAMSLFAPMVTLINDLGTKTFRWRL